MTFWAYLLHCNAGRFYAGHTDDLERRMAEHLTGAVPGYTRAYRPVTLVWSQDFASRIEALEAERRLKGWSRAKKMALIRGDWPEISRLSKKKDSASTSSARTDAEEALSPSVRPEILGACPERPRQADARRGLPFSLARKDHPSL